MRRPARHHLIWAVCEIDVSSLIYGYIYTCFKVIESSEGILQKMYTMD